MARSSMRPLATLRVIAVLLVISGVAFPVASGAQGVPPPHQLPAELEQYIARFSGADSTDCGRFLLVRPFVEAGATELEQAVTCARDASQGRKAFSVAKQEQGIDSLVFQGLIGTAEGAIYRFSYDSAPCGNPGCPGRFNVERCDRPAVVTDRGNRATFTCPR
jgi:hypothetical protein